MKKYIKTLLITFTIAGSMCMTCHAADFSSYWYQDGATGSWKITNGSQTIQNSWVCDDLATGSRDIGWYLISPTGQMTPGGIIQDETGTYYMLNMNHDGTYGMLCTAPVTVNGIQFVFNTSHDGKYGSIQNVEAVAQSGLPVTSVNLQGKASLYTSAFSNVSGSGGSGYNANISGGSTLGASNAGGGSAVQQQSSSAGGFGFEAGYSGGFDSKYENANWEGIDSSYHDFLQNIYNNGVFG